MSNSFINILIVDDRPENLLVLEGLLEKMDCNIFKAFSGNDALGLMLDHDFALVLMDVQMPEMDGFETAELMRGSERTRHVPIIFVTAINKEQWHIFKGYELGAVDYLFKPIEPIILQSKVRVFLDLYRQRIQLQKQKEELEQKIRELTALKVENVKLESLSVQDALTGIPNRRSFDRYMESSWKEAAREMKPISVIMLDIDNFKAYNDHYGHLQGDECLVRAAKAMTAALKRPMDFAARYGGEEFVIVLPDTDSQGAAVIGEAIRFQVEALAIDHGFSKTAPVVTVSLGAATIVPKATDVMEDFVGKADMALYRSKESGRNQVTVIEI